ncbi:MAG: hypothetical protein U0324_06025 [Polyangiales bacterium]
MPHDTDALLRALESLQLKVIFREHGWTQCLIAGAEESWRGEGADRGAALRDALHRALPTSLARALFEQRLGAEPAAAKAPAGKFEVVNVAIPQALVPAPVFTIQPPTATMPPTPPAAVSVPAPAIKPSPAPAAPATTIVPSVVPSLTPSAAPPAATPSAAAASVPPEAKFTSPKEVLAEVKAMKKQIEVDAEELALSSTRRQRLVLLGWITRARAAQTAFPDDSKIDGALSQLARTLNGYCQTWWPGSVRSLKITTRPEDVVHDLTIPVDRPPSTWQEAADAAERNVRQVEEEDEAKGRDGYGWADATRLNPPPRDADAMLDEIIAEVEKLSGPVGGAATGTETPDAAAFLEWARKLRWARETTGNPARWGALMGRFRYWLREHQGRFPDVSRTLDADYCPDRSWAALLGLDPETVARNRELRELFHDPPKAEDNPDLAALQTWLGRALLYSDTHLAQIVAAMQPFRDALATVDADKLPNADRRMRRRFSKLQKELLSPEAAEAPLPSEPIAPEAPELPSDPVSDTAAIPADLREPILPYTRGKNALFVSNRADPTLRDRLKQLFEFAELDWLAGETKRRQALVTPIASGTYQFVLGATGFLSHSIDGQISQACRKGKVPYVRVHRGRPLACLRAMQRELGLEEGSNHPATLPPKPLDDA